MSRFLASQKNKYRQISRVRGMKGPLSGHMMPSDPQIGAACRKLGKFGGWADWFVGLVPERGGDESRAPAIEGMSQACGHPSIKSASKALAEDKGMSSNAKARDPVLFKSRDARENVARDNRKE